MNNGIYAIRLFVDDDLVDELRFDKMCSKSGGWPPDPDEYYYCTTSACTPPEGGYNYPNVLVYRLSWLTEAGGHVWRIDVLDAKGNLLHGDPVNGLPGRYVPTVALKAALDGDRVILRWRIGTSELAWAGIESFELWQCVVPGGESSLMTATPIAATPEVQDYSFAADVPAADSVRYELVGRTVSGVTLQLGVTTFAVAAPVDALSGHPNPVGAGSYTVVLSLAAADVVDIWIVDLQGRQVCSLQRGPLAAGTTRVVWDGRDDGGLALPNGIYVLKVQTRRGAGLRAQKIVLCR
jgi:hypothetical protein